MNSLSISYITSNIAPFRIDLLDELAKFTNSVTLFYFNEIDIGVNPEYVKRRPKNVIYKKISNLSLIKQFNEINKNQVIIFDGYSGYRKIQLIMMMIFMKKRYVISIDGIIKSKCKNRFNDLIKRFLIGNAEIVFSTNHYTDLIIRNYSKNVVIKRHTFTTLNENDFQSIKYFDKIGIRKKYSIPTDKKIILYVGKFLKTKGIYELLTTICDEYYYLLIGGKRIQIESELIENKSNVRIIDFLEKSNVLEIMSASDVFVLPTYTDVWGLVVVEAVSCGIPVVTTNMCNSGVEFIRDNINGYLINKESVSELENAIDLALNLSSDEVKKYNNNLMKNYTINKAARNMLLVLNQTYKNEKK